MSILEDHMRRELRRFIVQKYISCSITKQLLDMDDSVFILDSDGDPAAAFSQDGWQLLLEMSGGRGPVLAEGYTVDESTVRS